MGSKKAKAEERKRKRRREKEVEERRGRMEREGERGIFCVCNASCFCSSVVFHIINRSIRMEENREGLGTLIT